MSPLLFLAAALAGGVGAVLRYLLDLGVARLVGRRFPWGILAVNLTGSFALGLVTTALPDAAFALWRDGERGAAAFAAVGMLVLGLLAAGLGLAVGSAL